MLDRRPGGVALLLLAAACRGAAPGADQARSDSALTARTWGLAYLQQQQLPRAEAEFHKVVALAPEQALGYADLGLVYLREGRTREAEVELQRAAALDSADSDVGLMLAEVYRLTGREADVLALVGAGRTSRQISAELHISPKTVENHKQRIFGKLGVQNQAHAVSVAMRVWPTQCVPESSAKW